MNNTIAIRTQKPQFNLGYLLLFIVVLASLFLVSNLFTIKKVAENTPDFSIDDFTEIAEEIYKTGVIPGLLADLPLDASSIAKMTKEIERILEKQRIIQAVKCINYKWLLQVIMHISFMWMKVWISLI